MKLTEADMTIPVLEILEDAPNGMLPMSEIKDALEHKLTFSPDDLAAGSRAPEPMWRQIAGNITSHRNVEGNIICEGLVEYVSRSDGLKITDAGRAHLRRHRN